MKTIAFLIALIVLCFSLPLSANDLSRHGSFLWNDIRDIKADGNYLYCAFSEGVGVIDLRRDYTKKKVFSSVDIPGLPRRVYLFESTLAVACESGDIWLVDKSNPAGLSILGSFKPNSDIWDLELIDDFIYAAVEYDGIQRYDISDPGNIVFDDSSMYGIRVVDLDVHDSILIALDNYNGLIMYRPDAAGIAAPVSELFLPRAGTSMSIYHDTVYSGIQQQDFMIAALNDILDAEYIETRTTLIQAGRIAPVGGGYVAANSVAGFEIQFIENDSLHSQLFPVLGTAGPAEFFAFEGREYIVYPHHEKGLVAYTLDDPYGIDINTPSLVLANSGPITQIEFIDSRLHTIGTGNWYELYSLADPENPARTGVMINPPYIPAGMCHLGDTVFVADYQTKLLFPAVDTGTGNPALLPPFFSIASVISRPYVESFFYRDDHLFYCLVNDYLLGTTRSPDGINNTPIAWQFDDDILAVLFEDSVLYAGLFNNCICIYGITEDFQVYPIASETVNGRVRSIIKNDTLLYLAANGLITASVNDEYALTEIETATETGAIYDIIRQEDRLYCAAQNGIFVFDISFGIPQLLFSGDEKATMIAVNGHTLAASDGSSVRVYTLSVTDLDNDDAPLPRYDTPRITGYPNPFNPAITMVLENLANNGESVTVDVFDVLGRRVTSLEAGPVSGSRQTVQWNGIDDRGRRVASGVYFIRARNNDRSAVFKAVLMK